MSRRYIETDPDTGAIEEFQYNETDDTFTVHRTADVGAVLEHNKKLQNDGTNGWSPSREMVHVASIPVEIQYVWFQKHGVRAWDKNHKEGVRRLLNDPEYRWLRVNNMVI